MWAAKDNYLDIVKLLLNKDADFKIKNRFGNTALKLMKKEGNREIVQMLEKAGAKE
jgi:ankyrin repeat protein